MTSRRMSQCGACLHFRSPLDTDNPDGPPACAAFPDAIPDEIWTNRVDHRQPYPGDHGIMWEADGDAEFPEWAMEEQP